jgi:hypothetical protein
LLSLWAAVPARPAGKLRFEVTVANGLLPAPTDGRVMVAVGRPGFAEPRSLLGQTEANAPAVLGADADRFAAGSTSVLDDTAAIYPIADLGKLPRGKYVVQAVFDFNRDLRLPDAPGNLVSEPKAVTLDPAAGGTVELVLTRALPAEKVPPDTADVKCIKLRSEKLSRFHGRDIYLRAGVLLPPGHAREAGRKYPLRVHIGGFGTRYTAVSRLRRGPWLDDASPKFILLHLDGAGPLGDPYQVDSANHGPYGAALTEELIPHVEKAYRGIGEGWARVTDGHSTGGWVSLALQVFYPDFFNGCWSHAPDPVDFRAFELIDIYRDANVYLTADGKERPAARNTDDTVRYTMRQEVACEMVLGRGDNWTLSGKDWGSWNATFGPRGKDGRPAPLWDKKTGKIDKSVLDHWKKYDLRLRLETSWAKLQPKLAGKLRVWVGEKDDYFLEGGVRFLDAFLKKARPPAGERVTFAPGQGHGWRGISDRELVRQMGAAVEAARPK